MKSQKLLGELLDGLVCRLVRSVVVPTMLSSFFAFAVPAAAQSDGCFSRPDGTKVCSSQPENSPQRSNSPDSKRPAGATKPADRPIRLRRRAGNPIRAAGGHKYLIEQFDASAVPSLKLADPCLCRDGTAPVFEFCTGSDGTYKVSCPR